MKNRVDIAHFAELIGLRVPESTTLVFNTIAGKKDPRWSKQTVGLVAYYAISAVKAFLYNEKSKTEAGCILQCGPVVTPPDIHPFIRCGAKMMKRGVWIWSHVK